MVPISSPETEKLARILGSFQLRATIARTAGLLTAPQFQANTFRLEVLAHLAIAHCGGKNKPSWGDFGKWLNRRLGQTDIALLEDQAEDVFISNVETPEGNRRVFEGTWESNDYFLQIALDTLIYLNENDEYSNLLSPAFALLQLSDCVANRLGLQRWHVEPSIAKGFVKILPATRVEKLGRAVTFFNVDLIELGISREALRPFVFRMEDKRILKREIVGNSSLERRPLLDFGDALILALPTAVSPAIRMFFLAELEQRGQLQAFQKALGACQARQVEDEGLFELKINTVSLSMPALEEEHLPSFHTWLLKYDINKYIHVILLHGQLKALAEKGFAGFSKYPEERRLALEKYLNQIANYCQAFPDCKEGMALLVMGGLGEGISLGFSKWPENWRFSAINIPDLLMLAGGNDRPIKSYLKCIKQREWAEEKGVNFQNINGDFNFYCYWRDHNCQLVPRNSPVGDGTNICLRNDFVIPIREELRNLNDRHVTEAVGGSFVKVLRYGRDSYFESMKNRPIYYSLDHIHNGILAGVVETPRGPTWLEIQHNEVGDLKEKYFYDLWSGFIGLFDRLVFEIEAVTHYHFPGPVEIRLNFREIEIPEFYVPAETGSPIKQLSINYDFDHLVAEIKFPQNFLRNFQNPENKGEKLVLEGISQALIGLHQKTEGDTQGICPETFLGNLIGNSGKRILHIFHTYYPIDLLLTRPQKKVTFINHEDFVFAKLKLSEGCTSVQPESSLQTKEECNDFLHKVVEKIWLQLRDLLRQLDRRSVIKDVLAIHEATIQDRDQWRRTAQALLALYNSEENVFSIAQKREQDRNSVALPARTILEMAICECPTSGGRQVSQWELDELLGKAALFLEAATDSDAIKSEIISPNVQLYDNGEYTVDRSFHETVIRPYLTNYFREGFFDAAGNYDNLYRREQPQNPKKADETYSADFIAAFKTEFGLTLDEAIDGMAELMELAVECDNVVVETTLCNLKNRLLQSRGLSHEAYQGFLKTFGLFHRPTWEVPPSGYHNRDLHPWRFRRRLSALVRPLLVFGEQDDNMLLYGVGTLRLGFDYLIKRTESGQLPDTFFTTKEMKKYIGTVNDKRGHAFAKSVAEVFSKEGWQVRNEVQMTEIGASGAFGDIDVLAWKGSGEMLLIECKRLQFARTVAEIAEICRRFRGEAKDDLDKHLMRVAWVMQHTSNLQPIVGFTPKGEQIDHRLVTNTHVPMMYLTSLPIHHQKITPIKVG